MDVVVVVVGGDGGSGYAGCGDGCGGAGTDASWVSYVAVGVVSADGGGDGVGKYSFWLRSECCGCGGGGLLWRRRGVVHSEGPGVGGRPVRPGLASVASVGVASEVWRPAPLAPRAPHTPVSTVPVVVFTGASSQPLEATPVPGQCAADGWRPPPAPPALRQVSCS